MKKQLIFGAVWAAIILGGLWYFSRVPSTPSVTVVTEIVKLEEIPGTKGWRLITVRFADGREMAIRTLAPFFFKPGYKARVGIFERPLFGDVYDIVSDSVD